MDTFENRRWLILPAELTGSINFNQVLEASPSTLRYSVDQTETFVKYDVTVVTASYTQSYTDANTGITGSYVVEAGVYGRPDIYSPEYPEYLYQPMLDLLATPFWTQPMPTGSIE
jgi:hypothetical protein